MKKPQQMPQWFTELMKEFTRPPYFLQHAVNEQKTASNTSPNGTFVPYRHGQRTPEQTDSRASHKPTKSEAPTPAHNQKATPISSEATFPDGHDVVETSLTRGGRKPNPVHNITSWQSVFRRHKFPLSLATAYGWNVRNASTVANVVRVETRKGSVYTLKQTPISAARVQFIADLLAYTASKGFHNYAPLIQSSKNKPYAIRQNKVYYATDWIHGRPANFVGADQLAAVARSLAQFHESARGFESNKYNPPMEFDFTNMLRKRTNDLRDMLLQAESKKHPDSFDTLFTRLGPTLRLDAETSIRLIDNEDCHAFLNEDENYPGVCHLDVIPDNFVFDHNQVANILDFDLSTFAPRALDIAHLVRRSLQVLNWHSEAAYKCFVEYHHVRPLVATEYQLVLGLLTFPHRAWRLAHARYKHFQNNHQTTELQEYADQDHARQAFLKAYAEQI